MNRFRSLHNAAQRQRLRAGTRHASLSFLGRPPACPLIRPTKPSCSQVPPVVDGLMTDSALPTNDNRMRSLAQHQQSRRAQSRIPPGMIDRQLEQRCAFAGAQDQGYFHRILSGVRS